jgi:iron-sulfur cluster assembly protein
MALKIIASMCTGCSACEPECPNVAIRERAAPSSSTRPSAPSAKATSTRRSASRCARSTAASRRCDAAHPRSAFGAAPRGGAVGEPARPGPRRPPGRAAGLPRFPRMNRHWETHDRDPSDRHPAAEKFMRRMVRFSEAPTGGFRLTVPRAAARATRRSSASRPRRAAAMLNCAVNGLRLFLPAESRLLLDGVTVDFADTPTQSGLTFFNRTPRPAAARRPTPPSRRRRRPCRCRRSSGCSPKPPEPSMDADFDAAVLGLAMPAGVEVALREASRAARRRTSGRDGCADARAGAGARTPGGADRVLPPPLLRPPPGPGARRGAPRPGGAPPRLGLPDVWREVPPRPLPGARHDAATRFYLFCSRAMPT